MCNEEEDASASVFLCLFEESDGFDSSHKWRDLHYFT